MRNAIFTLGLTLSLAGSAAAQDDFGKFLAWWPGDYDNLAQSKTQADIPTTDRNTPTRLFIRRVDLPAFGKNAYYAEWQDAAPPHAVTRQRIYGFDVDPASGKFRLALHIFPPDKAELVARTAGAYLDPVKLKGVTPADMAGIKGCDIVFARTGKAFAGTMVKGACAFPAPDGTPIYSWSQMKLTPDTFTYLDGWFRTDGTPYRIPAKQWYVFKKSRGTKP